MVITFKINTILTSRVHARWPSTQIWGKPFFSLKFIKGHGDGIHKVPGGTMKEVPMIVIIILALDVILIKEVVLLHILTVDLIRL